MVIDSSAVVSVLLGEPDAGELLTAIGEAPIRLMSAVNALETSIVIEARKGPAGGRELDLFLHRCRIEVVPMDGAQFEQARRAWRTFGKGQHPAGLNLGDCCAWALSRVSGYPLLFKGGDFAKTDVRPALNAGERP